MRRHFIPSLPLAVSLLIPALFLPTMASASEQTLKATYGVTFGGFKIARAGYSLTVGDGGYNGKIAYKTAGLVQIVSKASGEGSASGVIKNGRILPASYTLKSNEGANSKDVSITADGGIVKASNALPPLREAEDRVAVTQAHKNGSVDPISGLVAALAKPAAPLDPASCERTLPVFDGWSRYDLKLSFKGMTDVAVKGYKGQGLTCAIRYVPVAGHRENHANTRFMIENRDMDVTLIPTAAGYLLPVTIRIKTQSGQIGIAAEKVELPN